MAFQLINGTADVALDSSAQVPLGAFINDDAVQYIPGADLNRVLTNRPLAVNTVPIAGYNITSSFVNDESGGIDGWQLTLVSAVDIPAANTSKSSVVSPEDFVDVLSISLTPPPSLYTTTTIDDNNGTTEKSWAPGVSEALATWRFSATVLYNMTDEYYANARQDDGTCAQTLPDSCIEAMKEIPVGRGTADPVSFCEGQLMTHIYTNSFTNETLNFPFFGMGSTGHDDGEVLEFSDEAVVNRAGALAIRGRTMAVFVGWTGVRNENGDFPYDQVKETVSVACLNVESEESMSEINYVGGVEEEENGAGRKAWLGMGAVLAGLATAAVIAV